MRVVFFGTGSEFSRTVLAHLISAGIEVCAVVVPWPDQEGTRDKLVRSWFSYVSPTIVDLSRQFSLPILEFERPASSGQVCVASRLHQLHPDLACVASFPWRIPPTLLAVPVHGFLNLHPSLLPAYRGPVPLFWQFRNGEMQTGVTIHLMDEELDTGDIISQAVVSLPDGISGEAAAQLCAQSAGKQLVDVIAKLQTGVFNRQKQPDGGFYNGYPAAEDFQIPLSWSARHAFRFMRGTAEFGQLYTVSTPKDQFRLKQAITYYADKSLAGPYVQKGTDLLVQFATGVLHAAIAQPVMPGS